MQIVGYLSLIFAAAGFGTWLYAQTLQGRGPEAGCKGLMLLGIATILAIIGGMLGLVWFGSLFHS